MLDPCGAVHITIGDDGNSEGLSFLADNKMDLHKLPPQLMLHDAPCFMLQCLLASNKMDLRKLLSQLLLHDAPCFML